MEDGDMTKEELLKKLADDKFNHFESTGLPPHKCRQIVAESINFWKKLPVEELEKILGQAEY